MLKVKLVLFLAVTAVATAQHPLDPLTAAEFSRTATIIRNFRPGNWVFSLISLQEPEKSLLLPYFLSNREPPTGSVARKAFVSAFDQSSHVGAEAIVNLDTNLVERFLPLADETESMITPEEMDRAKVIAYANETVRARCAQIGWTDMARVHCDAWYSGYVGDLEQYRGTRTIVLIMYGSNFPGDNIYAHPFDFNVVVDLNSQSVLAIDNLPTHDDFDSGNTEGNIVPTDSHNYDPVILGQDFYRKDISPVQVSQSDGPSFTVTGNVVNWQKFKMRLGFNGREGLVLHHMSYNDSGNVRPLFYRVSLAEMFVPYGDPRPPYHRKHAYDVGEFGLGFCLMELESGVDCVGETVFVNYVLHDSNGEPYTIRNGACIREEDAGILWKHYDKETDRTSTTRSQRLAMTFIVNVDNYDYIVTWNFYQDGSIECSAKLTGMLNNNMLAQNVSTIGHGTQVSPNINAQYHQHFFTLRMDVEIDGNENSVVVQDILPMAAASGSPQNPYGNGITTNVTLLRTASQARTNVAPELSRTWVVRNYNSINPNTKQPVGWKLMPWASQRILLNEDSPILEQAAYMKYNTWVMPYKEDQLFPAGFYLNNTGLPEWVQENPNANIDNTDIVLWHSFGISHVPRVEDFPVMPAETIGIFLKPNNFFKENPSLDVPPPAMANRRAKKPRLMKSHFLI